MKTFVPDISNVRTVNSPVHIVLQVLYDTLLYNVKYLLISI